MSVSYVGTYIHKQDCITLSLICLYVCEFLCITLSLVLCFRFYASQVLLGLQYLHGKGIIYRLVALLVCLCALRNCVIVKGPRR